MLSRVAAPYRSAVLVEVPTEPLVLPGQHVRLSHGHPPALASAQAAGVRHGVPMSHMRFDEMFGVDHPDLA
jgi:hypothetical protein